MRILIAEEEKMYFGIAVLMIMLIASYRDIRNREISLLPIFACGAVSLLRSALDLYRGALDPVDLLLSLLPGALFLIIALVSREGVGYGDGLLLLVAGPALGFVTAALGATTAVFASGMTSGVLLTLRRVGRKTKLPFVPFLTFGMGVMIFAKV